jgi:hypothetical protein
MNGNATLAGLILGTASDCIILHRAMRLSASYMTKQQLLQCVVLEKPKGRDLEVGLEGEQR